MRGIPISLPLSYSPTVWPANPLTHSLTHSINVLRMTRQTDSMLRIYSSFKSVFSQSSFFNDFQTSFFLLIWKNWYVCVYAQNIYELWAKEIINIHIKNNEHIWVHMNSALLKGLSVNFIIDHICSTWVIDQEFEPFLISGHKWCRSENLKSRSYLRG